MRGLVLIGVISGIGASAGLVEQNLILYIGAVGFALVCCLCWGSRRF